MTEPATERSARYSKILDRERPALQDSLRTQNPGMTRHRADIVIDSALLKVAKTTLATGTDYALETAHALKSHVDVEIEAQMKAKPYRGFELGQ